MTELRLASINGEPTIPIGFDPVIAWGRALADSLERGEIVIEKAVLVAIVDGAVTYTACGGVTVMEATGLLELCSRRIERDALK